MGGEVEHRAADEDEQRHLPVKRNSAESADRRPTDDKAEANHENAEENTKRGTLLKRREVRAVINGASERTGIAPTAGPFCKRIFSMLGFSWGNFARQTFTANRSY